MLPPEIRRELERLADETASARARLARIRERLAAVRNMMDDLRRPVPGDANDTSGGDPTQELGQAKVG
jgi:hypothetical protein